MSEKLCVFCEHLYMDLGGEGYSEMTPGYPGDIHCSKRHWELSSGMTTEDFRKCILIAADCNDYKQAKP